GLSRPDAVIAAAHVLVDEVGVRGVIGPHASSDVSRVFTDVLRPVPALVISPSATSDALLGIDRFPASDFTPGFLWTTVAPEKALLTALAASLAARGVTSAYVVAPEGVGDLGVTELQAALVAAGSAATVASSTYVAGSRVDMIDAINRAAAATGS